MSRRWSLRSLFPVNSGEAQPEGSLTLAEFVEKRYLPSRERNVSEHPRKLSRYFPEPRRDGLGDIRLARLPYQRRAALFRCDGREDAGLSHQSLLRVKAFLSAVFTYARQEDVIRGANPMQGVKAEGRRYKPVRSAYTLEDIHAMLAKLEEPARTVVAVAAFTGLRASRFAAFAGRITPATKSAWSAVCGARTLGRPRPKRAARTRFPSSPFSAPRSISIGRVIPATAISSRAIAAALL